MKRKAEEILQNSIIELATAPGLSPLPGVGDPRSKRNPGAGFRPSSMRSSTEQLPRPRVLNLPIRSEAAKDHDLDPASFSQVQAADALVLSDSESDCGSGKVDACLDHVTENLGNQAGDYALSVPDPNIKGSLRDGRHPS